MMTAGASLVSAGLRLGLWCVIAFWLWLALGLLLRWLRLPFAPAIAATLSWVGAGLSLRWVLPVVGQLIALHFHVPPGFFTGQ